MKMLIFGDVHGFWDDLNKTTARALRRHPDTDMMIQVGDLGYAWPGSKPFKFSKSFFEYGTPNHIPFHWLDGNHENHAKLLEDGGAYQPGMTYQPRGSVLELEGFRMLFMGGATSVDKDMRIEGKSWWREEAITYNQVQNTLETVEGPIHAIFSHDHPLAFPYSEKRYTTLCGHGDRVLLEVLRQEYHPPFWFFGHHHDHQEGETHDTKWHCCPIIESHDYVVWDGERSWLEKWND